MKSLSNMPANISGVALKETDYIAFECQAFDASGVGFMKSWWLTTWKRKHISGMTWDTFHITLNHFYIIFIFLHIICVWFSYLNTFKMDITWFAITYYVINIPWSQIIFLPLILISHWSILPVPFPVSLLLLSGLCLSTSQSQPIIWSVPWSWLRLFESCTDITF